MCGKEGQTINKWEKNGRQPLMLASKRSQENVQSAHEATSPASFTSHQVQVQYNTGLLLGLHLCYIKCFKLLRSHLAGIITVILD